MIDNATHRVHEGPYVECSFAVNGPNYQEVDCRDGICRYEPHWHPCDDECAKKVADLHADLAAHRAVVRELAISLEAFVEGKFMDYGHAADVLAHPLVQQAREEPHV